MQARKVSNTTISILTSDMKNETDECCKSCKNQKNEYTEIKMMVDIHESHRPSIE